MTNTSQTIKQARIPVEPRNPMDLRGARNIPILQVFGSFGESNYLTSDQYNLNYHHFTPAPYLSLLLFKNYSAELT